MPVHGCKYKTLLFHVRIRVLSICIVCTKLCQEVVSRVDRFSHADCKALCWKISEAQTRYYLRGASSFRFTASVRVWSPWFYGSLFFQQVASQSFLYCQICTILNVAMGQCRLSWRWPWVVSTSWWVWSML